MATGDTPLAQHDVGLQCTPPSSVPDMSADPLWSATLLLQRAIGPSADQLRGSAGTPIAGPQTHAPGRSGAGPEGARPRQCTAQEVLNARGVAKRQECSASEHVTPQATRMAAGWPNGRG
mmetsp:Transcript_41104/g.66612  ORF Transcript_41104/g.66612 Transcript_41104/m.66612 type:complete len:120 (+) Transcript_41104:109-468(+)